LYEESLRILERAKKVIPGAAQTNSKSYRRFPVGVYPLFLKNGCYEYVVDVDNNVYLDWSSALGPTILGYNPEVNKAVTDSLRMIGGFGGANFSLPTEVEVDLAEKLVKLIPAAEMVRFGKTGSEVTSAAVRLARAYTGKEKIAISGYSGWSDSLAAHTKINAGIPKCLRKLIFPFEYNNIHSLEQIFEDNTDQIACVAMEPVIYEPPAPGFLNKVSSLCHDSKTALIFDEMVTCPRFHLSGAQKLYDVVPTIATIGKGLGGGFSFASLTGPTEIMDQIGRGEVFYSGTFLGETIGIVAALKAIEIIERDKVVANIWKIGENLKYQFNTIANELAIDAELYGLPPRMVFKFPDNNLKSLFLQETAKRGLLFGNVVYPTTHTKSQVDKTIDICYDVLLFLRKAIDSGSVKGYLNGGVCSDFGEVR